MKEEIYEISLQYMKDLKKQFKNKEISSYYIAHKAFRRRYSYWIIKEYDKMELTITYLNGDVRTFTPNTYSEFIKRIKMSNEDYKPKRKKYIKRYFKVINTLTKHRNKFKRNIIANSFNPQQIKQLAI